MTNIINTITQGGIYWLLFIWLSVFAFLETVKPFSAFKKYFAVISMLLMILMIGLRWETGTDWIEYKKLYDTLKFDWTFLTNIFHFDFGYVLFNAAVKYFTADYTVFLLINSFITIYLLYRLIKKWSPYPNLSLLFFYAAFMLGQFMGSNRRMMAMVFLLWAFYYLYEGYKTRYLLLVVLAALFHNSAIIGLIVFFIPKQMFSISKSMYILLVCFVLGMFMIPALGVEYAGKILSKITDSHLVEKMSYYAEHNKEYITSSVGNVYITNVLSVIKRSVFLIYYFYIIKRYEIDKLTGYIFNVYLIGFAGYMLFFGFFFQISSAYFAIAEIFLLGRMYNYTEAKDKFVILSVVFVYAVAQIISSLNFYPDLYMPYISRFSGIHRILLH